MASNTTGDFAGLFDLDQSSASYLSERKKGDDGLYRPALDKIKGKGKTYNAIIRILPNLQKDGKIGPTALEKHIHYADFKDNPELSGYYDCKKNFADQCELCNMYWQLKKSKNAADVEKAALINRTTKYYTYVLVVEDDNQPELVGKVLVWQYGFKILGKIKAELEGKRACRVEDLSAGMDLELVIKEYGGYTNYDDSKFLGKSPISLDGEPLEIDRSTGKIAAHEQAKVIELLKSRTVDLDTYKANPWTDEIQAKVNKIMAILSGNYVPSASDVTYSGAGSTTRTASAADVLGAQAPGNARQSAVDTASDFDDSFFDDMNNLDEV